MFITKLSGITKLALLGVLGLLIGGSSVFYYQKNSGPRRSLASIAPYKPHGLMIGKQAAAMTVELVGPESYPDNNTEIVELVGYITQHSSADSALTYEWSLPAGVDLVRGPLSDSLANLPLGRPQQVSILVRGFSRERQKLIALKSQVVTGASLLTASSVIVSRPEDTLEIKVMDLQAQAKAAAEEEKNQETK